MNITRNWSLFSIYLGIRIINLSVRCLDFLFLFWVGTSFMSSHFTTSFKNKIAFITRISFHWFSLIFFFLNNILWYFKHVVNSFLSNSHSIFLLIACFINVLLLVNLVLVNFSKNFIDHVFFWEFLLMSFLNHFFILEYLILDFIDHLFFLELFLFFKDRILKMFIWHFQWWSIHARKLCYHLMKLIFCFGNTW